MSRMTKYPNESLWTIGNSGTSSLQLNLTGIFTLPMGNTQDVCKSSKCAKKPCAHTSYWKKRVFPPSRSIGTNLVSVHGRKAQEVRKCPLACRYLKNESVVEKKTIFICFLVWAHTWRGGLGDAIACAPAMCITGATYTPCFGQLDIVGCFECECPWTEHSFSTCTPTPSFHIYIDDHDVKSRNLQMGQKTLQYHWWGGGRENPLVLIKYLTWIVEKREMAPVLSRQLSILILTMNFT